MNKSAFLREYVVELTKRLPPGCRVVFPPGKGVAHRAGLMAVFNCEAAWKFATKGGKS